MDTFEFLIVAAFSSTLQPAREVAPAETCVGLAVQAQLIAVNCR